MKIFRKKNRNTKGIVEAQLAGAETPAADASSSLAAPATFSNPFGLGQSESLVQPAFGDYGGSLQQGNGRSEENGAPKVHAVPEDVAPMEPTRSVIMASPVPSTMVTTAAKISVRARLSTR